MAKHRDLAELVGAGDPYAASESAKQVCICYKSRVQASPYNPPPTPLPWSQSCTEKEGRPASNRKTKSSTWAQGHQEEGAG